MRTILFVVFFSSLLISSLGASFSNPNTPNDGATLGVNQQCTLSTLTFTNGFSLVPAFAYNWFHYQCSCQFTDALFSTVAYPTTSDPMSSVEVALNGVHVNFKSNSPPNAISNTGGITGAPDTHSDSLVFQNGWNTILLGVSCTSDCYYLYNITCYKPPSTFIVGDPQFVGLRGQQYQVHGVAGEVYNIISDTDLQYNSKFVFLNEGDCPVVNDKKQKGCWSHPGSYLGELGLKTRAGDKIHLVTGDAKTGFALIEVNGKPMEIGETILLADDMGSITMNTTHLATVTIANWEFGFENSDMFVNQRVRVLDARGLRSHGLLGQTWSEKTYPNAVKYIQGKVDDYVIRDGDIFGDNFVYNTFN